MRADAPASAPTPLIPIARCPREAALRFRMRILAIESFLLRVERAAHGLAAHRKGAEAAGLELDARTARRRVPVGPCVVGDLALRRLLRSWGDMAWWVRDPVNPNF